MSSKLAYQKVVKVFDNTSEKVTALNNISFEIKPGELFCLLGPSGCGKTTLLRSTAGLETLSSGKILYGNKDISQIPPFRRNIGMVFQSFALYPHMSVFENVAYGLRIRDINENEIEKKVKNIMDLVGMSDVLERNPSPTALSGGQQQRVAIARSLVYDPEILLLDEPLASLDAKIRRRLRAEIRRIQKATNITTIYVTHDQEEAMAIGDRLAIMNNGNVEQIGSSEEVYNRPRNQFVANFIGKMNFFPARISTINSDEQYQVTFKLFDNQTKIEPTLIIPETLKKGEEVVLGLRPEKMSIGVEPEKSLFTGQVRIIQHLGQLVRYELIPEWDDSGDNPIIIDMNEQIPRIREGDKAYVDIDQRNVIIFSNEEGVL